MSKAMEHITRPITYLLDGISGTTLIGGIVTGQNILMLLGGLASLMAILNHGYQFWQKIKNKK